MTQLGVLTVKFHLEGCTSLKEKRSRLSGLRDRFGKLTHIAACESGANDQLDKGEWSFACLGQRRSDIQRSLEKIEHFAATQVDATLYERHIDYC